MDTIYRVQEDAVISSVDFSQRKFGIFEGEKYTHKNHNTNQNEGECEWRKLRMKYHKILSISIP
jgi:hypothetical protein